MTGRLVAFVGPSGVGKDSLMRAVAAARPATTLMRRCITRPGDAGGEDFDGVTPEEFEARANAGAFALSWSAHGMRYGIPRAVTEQLVDGDALVNLSRSILAETCAKFPGCVILKITARPETLAKRLAARGRETEAEIAARLSRMDLGLPPGIVASEIANDGTLDEAVTRILAVLQPVRA